jgi:hypothetical protein
MSGLTEEVPPSLVGALIVGTARDAESLVLKGMGELVDRGMPLAEATGRVEDILNQLEALL